VNLKSARCLCPLLFDGDLPSHVAITRTVLHIDGVHKRHADTHALGAKNFHFLDLSIQRRGFEASDLEMLRMSSLVLF
jgi:hypothetical protein